MRLTPMVAGPGRHSEAHVFANAPGWHRTSALRTLRKRGHRHTDGSSFRHSPQSKEPSDEDASKPNSSIPDIGDRVFDVPAYVGVVGSPFVAPPSVVAVGPASVPDLVAPASPTPEYPPNALRCAGVLPVVRFGILRPRAQHAVIARSAATWPPFVLASHSTMPAPEPLPALSSRRSE